MSKISVKVKRAYEAFEKTDGTRVLVDRLWPRGVSKAKAKIDIWTKEVAPTDALRKWFHADPEKRYEEFSRKYLAELEKNPAFEDFKEKVKGAGNVTFVTAAKDVGHSHVPVLMRLIA